MNIKNIAIVGVVVLVIGAFYILNFSGNNDINIIDSSTDINPSILESADVSVDENLNEINGPVGEKEEITSITNTQSVGQYLPYSPEILTENSDKKIVLNFKADWCPSCRVLDKNINENLSDIPGDLIILEVNYDTETDLKRKYGVTTQHTLVQVDSEGNQINKWAGGNTLDNLLSKIQ